VLSAEGAYYFVRFLRPGRWTVPVHPNASRTDEWEVRELDYWGMTVSVLQTLPHTATGATFEVSTTPGNFEIARSSGY
jgi:hypothetical protein